MWWTTRAGRFGLALFGVGALAGALCTLLGLWLLSGLFVPVDLRIRVAAVLVIGVVAVARDRGWVQIALPQAARQIPREVLQRGPVRGALQFGFELGTCVRTYMTGSAPYVVAAGILLLAPHPAVVAVAACGIAVGRTLPLVQAVGADREQLFLRMTAVQRMLTTATSTLTLGCFAVLIAVVARD